MKLTFNLLSGATLTLLIAAAVCAQDLRPKSATDLVLPDAEANELFESLKGHETRSLTNVNRIYVVSDRVTRDVFTQGVKIDEMIKSIEVSLNNVGIKTVKYTDFKAMGQEGYPFLKIKVQVTQHGDKNEYDGLVKVALTQLVVMPRIARTTTVAGNPPVSTSIYYPKFALVFGETWHTQESVINRSREDLARMVVDIVVNKFIPDYRTGNPQPAKAGK